MSEPYIHATNVEGVPLIMVLMTSAGVLLETLDEFRKLSEPEKTMCYAAAAEVLHEIADELEAKAVEALKRGND